MSSYAFHPEAFADLDEIWEYIAQNNIDAADGVLAGAYAPDAKPLWVVAILHGRGNPRLMAAALRDRA